MQIVTMQIIRALRRHVRRVAAAPAVDQWLRRSATARRSRRGLPVPADAVVTATGRGDMLLTAVSPPGTAEFERLALAAARRRTVTISPAEPIGADSVRELTRRGVPLHLDPDDPMLTGPPLEAPLAEVLGRPIDDGDLERYVRSVRLARLAQGPLEPPSISVLLATRRPHLLDHALAALRAQQGVELQLVLGLHGEWPTDVQQRIGRNWNGPATVVTADDSTTLGGLLDRMAGRADGTLLTKWDDDDWYGVHHVGDLVRARRASGAQIVGKAAEFVWLESADRTIRRPSIGARTYRANLAGGTLMISSADLSAIGGFPDAPRYVDRLLIERAQGEQCDVYRTHGLEFVLRRSADGGHTWGAGDDYFLSDAIDQRPGLDLGFAGIEGATETGR